MKLLEETRFCICQDCGIITPFTAERHNEDEFCECGGQFCGCDFCNHEYASHLKPVLLTKL
ncbi:hypothetical protein NB622_03500, partial [Vibrio parahaemolyticus]|uniref:hypothetical protein n=1 Tax=Vibrio parahaemolyticus TaxID=670 RepID=UPI00146B4F81|nr:hypothetical protein [Vibrio parahaemolyticus]EGQ8112607.1 hypothetical protein [Vibrio parahaemolyticus]EGQ8200319.1 hypothetical protein [Vibrio parahaemolyticus]EHA6962161.1 hypothetical protein [Vibrio parahaemolyticus]EHA6976539.1 hypothetical protein [Vibrio parahaemolyticus]EHH1096675.1 hypothetical protein [Vibrio parahaemolyticus]